MKTFTKILLTIALTLFCTFLLAQSTQNGALIFPTLRYFSVPFSGEDTYFATVGGTGGCTSWGDGCTFRSAVAKCTGTRQCNIMLGAGVHETNNVADATGTTIAVNYVHVVGFGDSDVIGQSSQLANGHVGATHVLRVTGSRFTIEHVAFDQSAQADKITTHLNLRGSYNTIKDCVFRQTAADGANTGILLDNTSVSHTIQGCRFRRLEGSGIEFGAAQRFYLNDNVFWKCVIGLYASSGSADGGVFRSNTYISCTTAWNIDAAVAKEWHSIDATFLNNTTNCAALSAYGGTIWVVNARTSTSMRQLFPAAAVGVTIAKDTAAWTQGAYVNFMTEDTITKPFIITAINVQSNNAAQTYRLELFYGAALASATTSLGNQELQVTSGQLPQAQTNLYVPARAALRAKLASSTAAADNIVISITYQVL